MGLRKQRRWCEKSPGDGLGGPTGERRCLGQSNGVLMYPGKGEAPGWGTWEKERAFLTEVA